jgi:hypothetical protein
MPRPKSEITGQNIKIHVRTTASLRDEFQRIGGAKWLRRYLAQSIEQRRQQSTERASNG